VLQNLDTVDGKFWVPHPSPSAKEIGKTCIFPLAPGGIRRPKGRGFGGHGAYPTVLKQGQGRVRAEAGCPAVRDR